jgi:tetratricopeptide (TPR) repeat protein
MKRVVQWIAAGASLAASISSPARAADPPTAAAAASPAGICISEDAKQSLATCPAGVSKFTPKGDKPQGVKLGQAAPSDAKLKENKPGSVDVSMQAGVRDLRRAQMKDKSLKLLISEIAQLEELWKATSPKAADRVTLARRMAETYVELENAAFRDKTEAEIKKDQPVADKAKKTLDGARANAIKYYKVVANEYKTYPQLDEVLYYLAYEYEQAQNLDEARKVYLQLINDTPQSKYIPNAYLAFGELFFVEASSDPSKFELAKQSYMKVLEYKESENKVWGYAQYKLGYVYWNLGERENFAKALDAFKKVIEYGDRHITEPGISALQKSARKDIVPVYALIGKPVDAYAFFKPLSGDKGSDNTATYEMMDNLGLNYLDTGHYPEAIALYEDLLQRDKGDKNCNYQAHIVQATMAVKGGSNKANIRTKLDDMVKRAKAFKGESHADDAKVSCANATVELLYETGAAWQIEAQGSGGVRGTGDKGTMKLAAELYNLITENYTKDDFVKFEFPKIVKDDWPSLFKIKYAKADLLYFQGDWEKCGPAFDAVVEEEPTGSDAPEAAYAAVLCYQKLYDQTHTGDKARKGTGNLPGQKGGKADAQKEAEAQKEALKKKEMSPTQKGMVQAFNRYVCYIKPSDTDAKAKEQYTEVKYARARTYFESHYWEEAAEGFKDIALNHADLDSGIYAAQLYLESLNILGGSSEQPRPACFDEMGEAVPKFLQLYCEGGKAAKNPDQCTMLTKIQCDIQRLKAQKTVELAAKSTTNSLRLYEDAATTYLNIWKKYGEGPMEAGQKAQCERIDEVLFNAAESFQSARLVMKSIQVRLILLNPKYGMDKSDLARKSVYKVGGNFQAIAVYDEAAKWYEKYSKEFPKGEKADSALSDAVVLRLGLGQDSEAIKDADDFMKTYGQSKPVETSRVAFAIGAHYVEREAWDDARKRLSGAMGLIDKSAPLDVQVQAHALLGRVYVRIKVDNNAATEYGKVKSLWKDPKASADKILADADGGGRRLGKALTAVGESFFYFAEKERKKVDAIRFPDYKGPNTKDDVLKHIKTKVADWMKKKRPAIEAAEKEYLRVVQLEPEPPPKWVIAAGSRVGGMWGEFVREFRAAPIPAEFKKDDELRTTYYSALDEASEPQKQRAKLAFETCLGYSVKYQFFDEYSRACEEWLSKTYKNEYHQVDEFRGAPTRVNSGLTDRAYPLDIDGKPVNPNPPAEPDKQPEGEKKGDDKAAEPKDDKKGGKKPAGKK